MDGQHRAALSPTRLSLSAAAAATAADPATAADSERWLVSPGIPRLNTIRLSCDSPHSKPTNIQIHQLIYRFCEDVDKIKALQYDFAQNRWYVTFTEGHLCEEFVRATGGKAEIKSEFGEVLVMTIDYAALGARMVKIFNVPIHVNESIFHAVLSPYGSIKHYSEDKWCGDGLLPVKNGIRRIVIDLKKHIPFNLTFNGYRGIITYLGQPSSFFLGDATDKPWESSDMIFEEGEAKSEGEPPAIAPNAPKKAESKHDSRRKLTSHGTNTGQRHSRRAREGRAWECEKPALRNVPAELQQALLANACKTTPTTLADRR